MPIAIWVAGFLLLWSPGYLIRRALGILRREDPIVRLALDLALGLCAWPVAMLVTSTLGISFPARAAVGVTILAAIGLAVVWGRRGLKPATFRPYLAAFAGLAGLAVAHRLWHIRDLAVPPWIDSVHHGMIVRLFIDRGAIPATCDPYIPGAAFYYHWGYHAVTSILGRFLGLTGALDIPMLMLHFGQLLNVLSVVMVYAAARVVSRSRSAGLLAAALAMFASWYPAYYLSWGRYTHLTGTLILPPLLIVLWRIGQGRTRWGHAACAAILAAGLVLVHVRIAFFAAVFAVMLIPVIVRKRHRLKPVLHWLFAALAAMIIVSPWVVRVVRSEYVRDFIRPGEVAGDDYHQSVPIDLVWSNRGLLSVATGGLTGLAGILGMPAGGRILSAAWLAAVAWAAFRKQPGEEPRRRSIRGPKPKRRGIGLREWRSLLFVGGYVVVIAILLTWQPFGLNLTRFASPASAVMTMFLPLSIVGGALAARVVPRRFAIAGALAIALIGGWQYRQVVNPQTIFTDGNDLRALRWIQSNTPPTAVFAIDGRPWTVKPAWAGIDGGYWINVATDRRTILPPSLYAWSLPAAEVETINRLAEAWSIRSELDASSAVTHIYIGSKTASPRRAALLSGGRGEVIYQEGPVAILSIRD